MRASGSRPSSRALAPEAMSSAAAPSLSGEELPAVTVPPSRKAGFSAASFSSELSARGPSSRPTSPVSFFLSAASSPSGTGSISAASAPDSQAASAFRCECSANSSCARREIL